MTALDRMPDSWWVSYGEENDAHTPDTACAQLRHVIEEEHEIELLVAAGRVLDGIAARRFAIPT